MVTHAETDNSSVSFMQFDSSSLSGSAHVVYATLHARIVLLFSYIWLIEGLTSPDVLDQAGTQTEQAPVLRGTLCVKW